MLSDSVPDGAMMTLTRSRASKRPKRLLTGDDNVFFASSSSLICLRQLPGLAMIQDRPQVVRANQVFDVRRLTNTRIRRYTYMSACANGNSVRKAVAVMALVFILSGARTSRVQCNRTSAA